MIPSVENPQRGLALWLILGVQGNLGAGGQVSAEPALRHYRSIEWDMSQQFLPDPITLSQHIFCADEGFAVRERTPEIETDTCAGEQQAGSSSARSNDSRASATATSNHSSGINGATYQSVVPATSDSGSASRNSTLPLRSIRCRACG